MHHKSKILGGLAASPALMTVLAALFAGSPGNTESTPRTGVTPDNPEGIARWARQYLPENSSSFENLTGSADRSHDTNAHHRIDAIEDRLDRRDAQEDARHEANRRAIDELGESHTVLRREVENVAETQEKTLTSIEKLRADNEADRVHQKQARKELIDELRGIVNDRKETPGGGSKSWDEPEPSVAPTPREPDGTQQAALGTAGQSHSHLRGVVRGDWTGHRGVERIVPTHATEAPGCPRPPSTPPASPASSPNCPTLAARRARGIRWEK